MCAGVTVQTETLQETVVDSLRNRVAAIQEAKKLMKEREKTRLDYAAYLRNVRNLKAKGDRGDKLSAVRAGTGRVAHVSRVCELCVGWVAEAGGLVGAWRDRRRACAYVLVPAEGTQAGPLA